jgi:septal ring factor EnvC (AmiA/AmiB activator)
MPAPLLRLVQDYVSSELKAKIKDQEEEEAKLNALLKDIGNKYDAAQIKINQINRQKETLVKNIKGLNTKLATMKEKRDEPIEVPKELNEKVKGFNARGYYARVLDCE